MTNKITKEFLFTELSIKIATLEMKLDKILELLTKDNTVNIVGDISVSGNISAEEFSQALKEATKITLSNQEWDELNK